MGKVKNFVLLGSPGAGKGTQARLLAERFGNLEHISTGDLFRNLACANTLISKKIERALQEGIFPPDNLATALLINSLCFRVRQGQGFILDGYPRMLSQTDQLDEFLEFLGLERDTFFVFINVSRKEAFRRLKARKRTDNSQEAINTRLDLFEKETLPIVEHYSIEGRLVEIDGKKPPLFVHGDIVEKTKQKPHN